MSLSSYLPIGRNNKSSISFKLFQRRSHLCICSTPQTRVVRLDLATNKKMGLMVIVDNIRSVEPSIFPPCPGIWWILRPDIFFFSDWIQSCRWSIIEIRKKKVKHFYRKQRSWRWHASQFVFVNQSKLNEVFQQRNTVDEDDDYDDDERPSCCEHYQIVL